MILMILCSLSDILNRLHPFLIPCPFKKITGIDCPGCGFQRSVIELLNGHFAESFRLYPATIPLLCLFASSSVLYGYKVPGKHRFIQPLMYFTGYVIFLSYLYKMVII